MKFRQTGKFVFRVIPIVLLGRYINLYLRMLLLCVEESEWYRITKPRRPLELLLGFGERISKLHGDIVYVSSCNVGSSVNSEGQIKLVLRGMSS